MHPVSAESIRIAYDMGRAHTGPGYEDYQNPYRPAPNSDNPAAGAALARAYDAGQLDWAMGTPHRYKQAQAWRRWRESA